MRPLVAYEYALLRAVPRVDRGESVNVGVVLYCQAADFVAARTHLDPVRLRCLDPHVDLDAVTSALAAVVAVCDGARDGSPRERFGWLTAPRSTVVQPGPVHAGLTHDPARDLDRLLTHLVHPVTPGP